MERSWRDLDRALAQRSFATPEEAQRFIADALEHGLPDPPPRTPLDEAQELVYEAWETDDPARRLRLARQALRRSPDCADAYVILAEQAASRRRAIRLLEEGVRAGERALGPEAFRDRAGEFWHDVFTRPYMRARAALAEALWLDGRADEAIAHLVDLLRLNPDDNMGLRYRLVSWYLERQRTAEAGQLLERYDEPTAMWLYSKALWRFQKEGDTPAARTVLLNALQANRYIAAYLLAPGLQPVIPDSYAPGGRDEALVYLQDGLAAWAGTDGAIDWLDDFVGAIIGAAAAGRPRRAVAVGRNDPCPCGSGKKYKHCCGRSA